MQVADASNALSSSQATLQSTLTSHQQQQNVLEDELARLQHAYEQAQAELRQVSSFEADTMCVGRCKRSVRGFEHLARNARKQSSRPHPEKYKMCLVDKYIDSFLLLVTDPEAEGRPPMSCVRTSHRLSFN